MEGDSRRLLVVPEWQPEGVAIDPAAVEECLVPFSSDSLHDLASPINQAGTIAGIFAYRYRNQLDENAEVLLGYMEKSARRLQDLVDGLSRYVQAMGLPGPYRCCDVNALVASAIKSIQGTIDLNGAVVTHDALPELHCHPGQIRTVFANLIENSIVFRREERPEIHISATCRDNTCFLSVKDNGLGIAPSHRKRIFALFTKAHQLANPRAGVGLAIVRRIVENHQGRIWIESEVGRGTSVTFTMPQGEGRRTVP